MSGLWREAGLDVMPEPGTDPLNESLRMIYGRFPLGADLPVDADPLLLTLYDDHCPLCDEDKHRRRRAVCPYDGLVPWQEDGNGPYCVYCHELVTLTSDADA